MGKSDLEIKWHLIWVLVSKDLLEEPSNFQWQTCTKPMKPTPYTVQPTWNGRGAKTTSTDNNGRFCDTSTGSIRLDFTKSSGSLWWQPFPETETETLPTSFISPSVMRIDTHPTWVRQGGLLIEAQIGQLSSFLLWVSVCQPLLWLAPDKFGRFSPPPCPLSVKPNKIDLCESVSLVLG